MAFFNWEEKYSVHVSEIDQQHKALVALLNQLYDAMQAGKGNQVMGKVLGDLINYTKNHFAHEERLMKAANYPDLPAHQAQHADLTRKALDLQTQFQAGKTTLTLEVSKFLRDWLSSHILQTDKKYEPFLNKK